MYYGIFVSFWIKNLKFETEAYLYYRWYNAFLYDLKNFPLKNTEKQHTLYSGASSTEYESRLVSPPEWSTPPRAPTILLDEGLENASRRRIYT